MATVWIVFKIATESADRINLSSSLDDGSLRNRLSIDRFALPPKVCWALLIAALVAALTLEAVVELPNPVMVTDGKVVVPPVYVVR